MMIDAQFDVDMPEDEAGFIAMHLIDAQLDLKQPMADKILRLIEEISNIVRRTCGIEFDKDSLPYYRFVTHLKFFAQRMFSGVNPPQDDVDEEMEAMVQKKYQRAHECAARSGKKMPVITMVHALKPMIFSEVEPLSDAIVVGYGVSDAAYFDILTGKSEPQGLLPMQQPKDMVTVEKQLEDVPRDMECYTDSEGHSYDFAYGLNWKGVIKDARTAKYAVPVLKR